MGKISISVLTCNISLSGGGIRGESGKKRRDRVDGISGWFLLDDGLF